MEVILERDGPTCVWCGRHFDRLVVPTTEHVVPRIKGGPSWLENEVAACGRCNSERGNRTPAEFADESDGLARHPDRERLVCVMRSLEERIARVGGQRRARPYVRSQLRRLDRA